MNTQSDELFGATTIRLGFGHWVCTAMVAVLILLLAPKLWFQTLALDSSDDYRIPYAVSKDYALYEQHLKNIAAQHSIAVPDNIAASGVEADLAEADKNGPSDVAESLKQPVFVVGDSVVWGEYVRKDGTLSHFLSQQVADHSFSNAGINGLFPLALEGLLKYYAGPIQNQKVLLHCNLLWMSSPEADLSTSKERVFNHVELVPQLLHKIPCYKANLTERTARVIRRQLPHLRWVRHLQVANFDAASIPEWTLRDDGKYPPSYPNSYTNPLSKIQTSAAEEPAADADRGPSSNRHKPWDAGQRRPQSFDWVLLEESLQWAAFQRLVRTLTSRRNDVLVVIGPFNEHMVATSSRQQYDSTLNAATTWLQAQEINTIVPEVLPSELYGDASHPLTDGYKLLAERLVESSEFKAWLQE